MREVIIRVLDREEIDAHARESFCIDEETHEAKVELLAPYQNMGELIRCKDCRYLNVINSNTVYAICRKHGIEFLPFEDDARECFCSWAERKEE